MNYVFYECKSQEEWNDKVKQLKQMGHVGANWNYRLFCMLGVEKNETDIQGYRDRNSAEKKIEYTITECWEDVLKASKFYVEKMPEEWYVRTTTETFHLLHKIGLKKNKGFNYCPTDPTGYTAGYPCSKSRLHLGYAGEIHWMRSGYTLVSLERAIKFFLSLGETRNCKVEFFNDYIEVEGIQYEKRST